MTASVNETNLRPEEGTALSPVRVLLPVDDRSIRIPEDKSGDKTLLREIVETILITLLLFVGVKSAIQSRWVDGESMEPTLHPEERPLIDRVSYLRWQDVPLLGLFAPTQAAAQDAPRYVLGQGPRRGDIIVLHPPVGEPNGTPYIKRIVALAGETVEIKQFDGVYIDGVRLDEPYIKESPNYNYGPQVVPPGHVFVLGDNRRNSSDSHAWGPLNVQDIIGKAWISYWPREMWGILTTPSYAGVK
jgi:signal peptidase I